MDRSVVHRLRHWDSATLNANTQPSSRSLRISWSRKRMTRITTSAAVVKCKSNVLTTGDEETASIRGGPGSVGGRLRRNDLRTHMRASGPSVRIVIHWRSVNRQLTVKYEWAYRGLIVARSYIPHLSRDTHKSTASPASVAPVLSPRLLSSLDYRRKNQSRFRTFGATVN